MHYPTPAIVSQAAVRRLPRLALWLFCLAYLIPGFIGRDAWKSADATALGYMAELAQGSASWWQPTLMGQAPESAALLPYWLGAWSLALAPAWMAADFAARLPFVALLALSLFATWYGTYYLARSPQAQPLAFAFGGEALPKDYARALGDGGLLAFIACLGLAQLSHETTVALAQLAFASLTFAALSALPYRGWHALGLFAAGVLGLSLSGAAVVAACLGLGGACIHALDHFNAPSASPSPQQRLWQGIGLLLCTGLVAALSVHWNVWRWRFTWPMDWAQWSGYGELLLWFTWPAWPLALWTLWRWRRQLRGLQISRHLLLPLWFVVVGMGYALGAGAADQKLLLALPALAALAAFSLPTLKRQMAALIDWFTLLFFSGCAIIIWIVWIAMLTGFPSQPAANVARLAPGFEAYFSWIAFGFAGVATLVWAWLVAWRIGRHRAAMWRSLVLPAGGAALCWLLLMTLWMPLLNYAQSYTALVHRTVGLMEPVGCVEVVGLGQGKIAAFQFYGNVQLKPAQAQPVCPWLIAEPQADMSAPAGISAQWWQWVGSVSHPTDGNEAVLLFRRQ